MKILKYLPMVLALALTSCSDLIVPDLNNPGLDQLKDDPTRSAVLSATQGLFISARVGMASRAGYVSGLGIVGRESYNFDGADPRFSAQLLVGPLDGGSPAFGGAHWTARFRAVRGADNVLLAVAELSDADLAPAEKAGIRGNGSRGGGRLVCVGPELPPGIRDGRHPCRLPGFQPGVAGANRHILGRLRRSVDDVPSRVVPR